MRYKAYRACAPSPTSCRVSAKVFTTAQNSLPSPLSDGAWALLVTIEANLPPGCPRDNPQKNKDLADTAHRLRMGLK
jgi:hypothetical protein